VRWFRFDLFQHVPKDQPTSWRCSCVTNMPIAWRGWARDRTPLSREHEKWSRKPAVEAILERW